MKRYEALDDPRSAYAHLQVRHQQVCRKAGEYRKQIRRLQKALDRARAHNGWLQTSHDDECSRLREAFKQKEALFGAERPAKSIPPRPGDWFLLAVLMLIAFGFGFVARMGIH